jgi:hypothetical protein
MSRSRSAPLAIWAVCLAVAVAVCLRGQPVEAGETPAERQARLERMDAADKQKLRQAQELFNELDKAEQKRLRDLSEKIEAHPDRDKLLAVMEQYCAWVVDKLSVYERDALRKLEPAERIQRIKELREEQASREKEWSRGRSRSGGERLWKLASKEEAALGQWIDEYVAANASELLEALPEPLQKELLAELEQAQDDPESRRKLFARLWMRWKLASRGRPMPVDEAAWERLHRQLSPDTRAWLDKFPPNPRRWFARGLIEAFVFLHTQEELSEYLENKLKPADRDWLTNLPPEEMREELWRRYVRSKWPDALPPFPEHRRPPWRGGFPGRSPGAPGPRGPEPGGPPRHMGPRGPRDRVREGPPEPPPEAPGPRGPEAGGPPRDMGPRGPGDRMREGPPKPPPQ